MVELAGLSGMVYLSSLSFPVCITLFPCFLGRLDQVDCGVEKRDFEGSKVVNHFVIWVVSA